MAIAIPHKALGHLVEAVDTSVEIFRLTFADAQAFLAVSGDTVYAMVRGSTQTEIVKIIIADSIALGPGYLKVKRGQSDTAGENWPAGSLILTTTNEVIYNTFFQPGSERTIDYNPNTVLAPNYSGEKVYQDGPAGCERWWKAWNAVDMYWDLITGVPCGGETYEDVGFDYLVLVSAATWENKTDNTYWTPVFGAWDGSKWSGTPFLILQTIGVWSLGYRPTKVRLTRPTSVETAFSLSDTASNILAGGTVVLGPVGTEFALDFSNNLDIRTWNYQNTGAGASELSLIEFLI